MSEFELPDDDIDANASEEEEEISFADNGKPANYIFVAVDDPQLGAAVAVVPTEYWDAETQMADWDLKLEVSGFTQEAEGVYTYDHSDAVAPGAILEVLHRKFEKLGVAYSDALATWYQEENSCDVFRKA